MDRRKFLEGMAVLGALGITHKASGAEHAERMIEAAARKVLKKGKSKGPAVPDENIVCIISDLHVRPGKYQEAHLIKTIDEILALNPLPKYVLCLGDIAYLTGKVEEYAAAKVQLDRLAAAGMEVTLAMGNHDRRANFAEVFPDHAAASLRPDRYVYKVETPRADFILMDSLQEGSDTKKWITPGAFDDAQVQWLKTELEARSGDKPVFVMAHHPLGEVKIGKILLACPSCCGYIYGHNHIWDSGWTHVNYKDRTMMRTLCVPSTGHWGDIGFVTLRLEEDKAVASLHEQEFYFPTPVKEGEDKPELWTEIEREHRGACCEFPYQRV